MIAGPCYFLKVPGKVLLLVFSHFSRLPSLLGSDLPTSPHLQSQEELIESFSHSITLTSSFSFYSFKLHSTLFLLIEVKFTWHKTNHFKVNNSGTFSTFMMLCDHYLYLAPKYFITPKGNPTHINRWSPFPAIPTPWQPNLLSVFMKLPIVDVSYKWNHTV